MKAGLKMKLRDQKGQALVELAISIFVLVLIVFGVTEFGRVMYIRNTLNLAAREGARLASVTSPVDTSKVDNQVKSCIPFNQDGLTIEITPAVFTSGCTITVVATLPFQTVVPLLITQLDNITLTGQASMRYEY